MMPRPACVDNDSYGWQVYWKHMAMCKQLCRYRAMREGRWKLLFPVAALILFGTQAADGAEAAPQDPPAILETNQCRPVYPHAALE
ncbi:MAG TPA: hypothetical protein VF798_08755, partial [Burkholderiaceae bacterium]